MSIVTTPAGHCCEHGGDGTDQQPRPSGPQGNSTSSSRSGGAHSLADVRQGVGHGLAALEEAVQPVRLFLEELHGLHLHAEDHTHFALQAGKISCNARGGQRGKGEARGSEQAQGRLSPGGQGRRGAKKGSRRVGMARLG